MPDKECTKCLGDLREHCKESGVMLDSKCSHCEGTGKEPTIYHALVLTHKNIGNHVWMHPTLFDTIEEAKRFTHREFIVIKTIEVRV